MQNMDELEVWDNLYIWEWELRDIFGSCFIISVCWEMWELHYLHNGLAGKTNSVF